jgi:hypothetical protein
MVASAMVRTSPSENVASRPLALMVGASPRRRGPASTDPFSERTIGILRFRHPHPAMPVPNEYLRRYLGCGIVLPLIPPTVAASPARPARLAGSGA